MAIKKTTTVETPMRKVNGKKQYFFRTTVPKDLAIEVLGLRIDKKKQQLTWTVKDKKVIVEAV